ncbi:MAG: hypothetical protein ACREJM_00400 [Candidatus Saccharimonadales bacterium]
MYTGHKLLGNRTSGSDLAHMHDTADDAAVVHALYACTSVGKCVSIRANCSSLSQNSSLLIQFPRRINAVLSEENG